jgi:hypothetical protein
MLSDLVPEPSGGPQVGPCSLHHTEIDIISVAKRLKIKQLTILLSGSSPGDLFQQQQKKIAGIKGKRKGKK